MNRGLTVIPTAVSLTCMDRNLLDPTTDNRRQEARNVSVQLNVKVPWHYREQLVAMAKEQGVSLNRLVVNGLVRSYPPEQ
jgi:predicted HicB family RNase H-like nuclease